MMETQTCRTCGDTHPLTEEFWNRNKQYKSGFKLHCKSCSRKSQREADARLREKHGGISREKTALKKLTNYDNEPLRDFEKAALKDQVKRLDRPVISTYREI